MSRENIELALRAMRAAAQLPKPDFATMNEVFDRDHVFVPAVIGEHEGRVGADGYRAWLRDLEGHMPLESNQVEGAVDLSPTMVLGVTSSRLAGRSSGAAVEQRFWFLMTVIDGKIKRTEAYTDPANAIRASRIVE